MINIPSTLQSRHKNTIHHTIVDYRNAKYQGTIETQTRLPQGMGMLLTQDYHVALGFWKQGKIQGQCFILYPHGGISFGIFSKGQPKDICCYQFPNGKVLYAFTNSSQDCLCLVDSYNKLITVVRMHCDSRKQFFENMCQKRSNYSKDEIQQGKEVFFRKQIQILEQTSYQTELDKWTKIQEYSKQVIKSEFKDYKSFIRFNFCNLPQGQFQLTQTKQEVQLRFKKSSIICHLIENISNQNSLRCKLIGYYDDSKRKVEILRKVGQGIDNKVEETCDEQTFSYTSKRPIQAKQKLIDYFKKSTHFVNTYINSRELEIIGTYFQSLYEMIDSQISSKKAQVLLQLGKGSYPASPSPPEKYKQELHYKNIDRASLSEVTNETLEKINRKNANHYSRAELTDKLYRHNEYKSPSRYEQTSQYVPLRSSHKHGENYHSPQKQRSTKYKENSPLTRQKNYLIYAQQRSRLQDNKMKVYQSPTKSISRKYNYTNKHNHSINAEQLNYRYSKKKLTLDLRHSRSDYQQRDQQSYYHPEKDDRYDHSRKRQSITKLTKDYELINHKLTVEKQIRKDYEVNNFSQNKYNCQNSRSPKKYSYLKSPAYSPSSQSNKGRRQWR